MTITEKLELEVKKEVSDDLKISSSRLKRMLYYIVGDTSLALGLIGLIFPILPTTPFLLLSAASFARNSERAYNWLVNNKIFGKFIQDYRAGKGLPTKIKIYTIFFLWMTIIISMLFISILWINILLLVIASLVSIHILLIKPKVMD